MTPKNKTFFDLIISYAQRQNVGLIARLAICSLAGVVYHQAYAQESAKSTTPAPAAVGDKKPLESLSPITVVELWLGKTPQNGGQGVAKGNLKRFDMRGLDFDDLETYDIQYDKISRYRGIHLRDLIAVMNPIPAAVDMVILHTSQGMLIPLALKDLREDREIFVASAMMVDGKWIQKFPTPTTKGSPATQFKGNKLVAGTHYRAVNKDGFNPWLYAGSLVAVELVESRAYYATYSREDGKSTARGHSLYLGRCWMCHSVQGLGGTLGPELTRSKTLESKKGFRDIFHRVAGPQPKQKEAPRHLMPYQKDVTLKEAKSLWFWLKDVKKEPLTPYRPSYETLVKWEN